MVAREITKLHEELFRGTIAQALDRFDAPRGEITLVIEGAPEATTWGEAEVRRALREALVAGASPSRAAKDVAAQCGWRRREVYRLALDETGAP